MGSVLVTPVLVVVERLREFLRDYGHVFYVAWSLGLGYLAMWWLIVELARIL